MAEQTVREYLKALKLQHRLMLVAVVLISCAAGYVSTKATATKFALHTIGVVALIIAALACVIVGTYLFKKNIDDALANRANLTQKLVVFRKASILRWALIEAPILFCTVLVFLTGNYYYFIISFVLFVFFTMYAPSKDQIINHLQLSTDEQLVLQDEYAVL